MRAQPAARRRRHRARRLAKGPRPRIRTLPADENAPRQARPRLLLPPPAHASPSRRRVAAIDRAEDARRTVRRGRVLRSPLSPAACQAVPQKFLQSNPPDDVLLALRDKYGPALFLRLSHNPDLQPAGASRRALTTAATRKRNEDTAYLDSLIHNLSGPPEDRDTAQEILNNIGPSIVPRMLQHVAAPQGTESVEVLVQSIVRMGQRGRPALARGAGVADRIGPHCRHPSLGLPRCSTRAVPVPARSHVRRTSADRHSLRRSPGPLPDSRPADGRREKDRRRSEPPPNCEKWLARLWRTVFPGRPPTVLTDVWTWNNDSKVVVDNRLPPVASNVYTALRFAREALGSFSGGPRDRRRSGRGRLCLACGNPGRRSVGAKLTGSPNDTALIVGPEVLSDALTLGLKLGNPAVSVDACELCPPSEREAPALRISGPRSPVLAALNDPNPDVQYAAAVAVLQSQSGPAVSRFAARCRNPDPRDLGDEFALRCRRRCQSPAGQ